LKNIGLLLLGVNDAVLGSKEEFYKPFATIIK